MHSNRRGVRSDEGDSAEPEKRIRTVHEIVAFAEQQHRGWNDVASPRDLAAFLQQLRKDVKAKCPFGKSRDVFGSLWDDFVKHVGQMQRDGRTRAAAVAAASAAAAQPRRANKRKQSHPRPATGAACTSRPFAMAACTSRPFGMGSSSIETTATTTTTTSIPGSAPDAVLVPRDVNTIKKLQDLTKHPPPEAATAAALVPADVVAVATGLTHSETTFADAAAVGDATLPTTTWIASAAPSHTTMNDDHDSEAAAPKADGILLPSESSSCFPIGLAPPPDSNRLFASTSNLLSSETGATIMEPPPNTSHRAVFRCPCSKKKATASMGEAKACATRVHRSNGLDNSKRPATTTTASLDQKKPALTDSSATSTPTASTADLEVVKPPESSSIATMAPSATAISDDKASLNASSSISVETSTMTRANTITMTMDTSPSSPCRNSRRIDQQAGSPLTVVVVDAVNGGLIRTSQQQEAEASEPSADATENTPTISCTEQQLFELCMRECRGEPWFLDSLIEGLKTEHSDLEPEVWNRVRIAIQSTMPARRQLASVSGNDNRSNSSSLDRDTCNSTSRDDYKQAMNDTEDKRAQPGCGTLQVEPQEEISIVLGSLARIKAEANPAMPKRASSDAATRRRDSKLSESKRSGGRGVMDRFYNEIMSDIGRQRQESPDRAMEDILNTTLEHWTIKLTTTMNLDSELVARLVDKVKSAVLRDDIAAMETVQQNQVPTQFR